MPEDFVAEQLKSVLSDMQVDVVSCLHIKALVRLGLFYFHCL